MASLPNALISGITRSGVRTYFLHQSPTSPPTGPDEFDVVQVFSPASERVVRREDERAGVDRAARGQPVERALDSRACERRVREGPERLLEPAPGRHPAEEPEEDDPRQQILGAVVFAAVDHVADQELCDAIRRAVGVAELVATQDLIVGPRRRASPRAPQKD